MEELRENVRFAKAEDRTKKREVLQDSMRHLVDVIMAVKTSDDMKRLAENLTKKSAISSELLIAIKNGLLLGNDMIKAFLSVSSALPSLVRLFSSSSDARLQILAAHCLCNLALGGVKVSSHLAKMAGPYLVNHMEGMNPLLAEASLRAVGNMSLGIQAFEILHVQGAYKQASTLLATTEDSFVLSAAAFCLTRVLKNHFDLFNDEEYAKFVHDALSVQNPTPEILLIFSLMAHVPVAADAMIENRLHLKLLPDLTKVENDASVGLTIVRILANLLTESTGKVAEDLIYNEVFQSGAVHQLKCKNIKKETLWMLANIFQHENDEVKIRALRSPLYIALNC